MMVVVVIIALFAALVLPKMLSQAGKAKKTAAHAQINAYLTALGSYKLDTGVYPTTEQGLQALRVKPENVNNWQGPYTQKDIGNDPWGNPYVYRYPGEHGDDPDIISLWQRRTARRGWRGRRHCQLEKLVEALSPSLWVCEKTLPYGRGSVTHSESAFFLNRDRKEALEPARGRRKAARASRKFSILGATTRKRLTGFFHRPVNKGTAMQCH